VTDDPVVAVVGEVLTDFVPGREDGWFHASAGGSPGNVAVGLARLGVRTRMLARLSGDLLGRRLRAHLDANGVDLSHAVPAVEPSSLAIVALGEDGSAEYDFRLDGTADWQWTDAELISALDGVDAVCLGSLATIIEPGAGSLRRLAAKHRSDATVVYDPNLRPGITGVTDEVFAIVDELVALSDVVKVSEEDLASLRPGRPVLDVARDWLARGPRLVVVTRGADGVVAVGRSCGVVERPAPPVGVVDTVGAGDSFQAALVHGLGRLGLLGPDGRALWRGLEADLLAAVLDQAVAAAAITCSRRGADPPTGAELQAAYGDR
jgi:fructokinase